MRFETFKIPVLAFFSLLYGSTLFYSVGSFASQTDLSLLRHPALEAPTSGVMPFKDWKAEKVIHVSQRLQAIKAKLEASKAKAASETYIAHVEKELSQEQWNLAVAQDLTIREYVALYVQPHRSKTRFQEAAFQLNPADIAELIEAYSELLGPAVQQQGLPGATASNLKTQPSTASLQLSR